MREHRVGAVAWIVGGAAAMLFMGLALDREMSTFPGGREALARSVLPAAEAMRVLRWPAEHLETLGGYLTFHNVTLVSGFLALYAGLQGASLIRRPEAGRALEIVLATGEPRWAYLRDRVLGLACVIIAIALGIAVGIGWALAASGEPDWAGSLITMASIACGSLTALAIGLLLSQLVTSPRSARGITAIVLVTLYLVANAVDPGDPLGWMRFATPFFWVNASRALVPGYGLDAPAFIVLGTTALLLTIAAAAAFAGRDYGAGLIARRPGGPARAGSTTFTPHWWLRAPWLASLAEHRWGLLAWVLASAAFSALMVALQPAAAEIFDQFSYYLPMIGGPGSTPASMYLTFTTDVLAPIVAAFAVVQAADWIAERDQGRVETLLAAPLSWTRLVLERIGGAVAGVAVIVLSSLLAFLVGSALVGAQASVAGLLRVAVVTVLLGWGVTALASAATTGIGGTRALTALAAYLSFAFLLTWLVPMFAWPSWILRLSVFALVEHPYRAWPEPGNLLALAAIAVGGTALAVMLAERTDKTA